IASLALFEEAGMAGLQAKMRSLHAFICEGIESRLGHHLQCVTPRDAGRHGAQVSLRVRAGRDAGRRLFEGLAARGVVADWREPDILRVAAVPLYNTHRDAARLLTLLAQLLEAA